MTMTTKKTIDVLKALRKEIDDSFSLLDEYYFTIVAVPDINGVRNLTFGVVAPSASLAMGKAQVLLDKWCAMNKRSAKYFTLLILKIEPSAQRRKHSQNN